MSYEAADSELKQLADRWVAQWNEPGPDARRQLIRDVWAEDAYEVMINPPQGVRDTAAEYAVPVPPIEIRGHDALYARVTRAYEMFVAGGEYRFEQDGDVIRHAGAAIALTWVLRSRASGSAAGSGLDVLTFGPDGRVRTDHQFVA